MIKFKYPFLEKEFEHEISPRLRSLLYAVSGFVKHNFHKDIDITELMRDQDMQDRYYKNDPKYKVNPWKSVHQFGRGADIRSSGWTTEQIKQIDEFVDKYFDYGEKQSSIYHDVGHGAHLHFQVQEGDQWK